MFAVAFVTTPCLFRTVNFVVAVVVVVVPSSSFLVVAFLVVVVVVVIIVVVVVVIVMIFMVLVLFQNKTYSPVNPGKISPRSKVVFEHLHRGCSVQHGQRRGGTTVATHSRTDRHRSGCALCVAHVGAPVVGFDDA